MIAIYNRAGLIVTRMEEQQGQTFEHLEEYALMYYIGELQENHTHIIEGAPTRLEIPVRIETLLTSIREERNKLLFACDHTQLVDAVLTPEQHTAYVQYRQALRDFPATCDPYNPEYPIKP